MLFFPFFLITLWQLCVEDLSLAHWIVSPLREERRNCKSLLKLPPTVEVAVCFIQETPDHKFSLG